MILGVEEIEKRVWEEEKVFLMKQVGILLIKNNAIKFGDYILASGKKSPYYVDLRQTISSPITMDWIANSLTRIVLNEIGKERSIGFWVCPRRASPLPPWSARNWASL